MLSLQQELETLREERARERDMAARRQRQDEEEIQSLRDQLDAGGGGGSVRVPLLLVSHSSDDLQVESQMLDQLRAEMDGLVSELTDLSQRNDDLAAAKDNDLAIIRDLETQMKDYKRKYEQAKTELRSVKGTRTRGFPLICSNNQLQRHHNCSYSLQRSTTSCLSPEMARLSTSTLPPSSHLSTVSSPRAGPTRLHVYCSR